MMMVTPITTIAAAMKLMQKQLRYNKEGGTPTPPYYQSYPFSIAQ